MVTALITTRNRQELCQKAINSVLAQTYPDIEIIVVDDASDKKMQIESPRVRYIYIEESKGGNHARNVGVQAAKGKYVAFLDDDDEWMPDKIEKQMAYITEHPDVGIVSCGREIEYNFTERKVGNIQKTPSGDVHQKIFVTLAYTTSTLFIKKDLLMSIGAFDEELTCWQDYEMLLRICQISLMGFIAEPLVLYRVISSDKKRLTNNIDNWVESVAYIEEKHKELIDALPRKIRAAHHAMIARDGCDRAYKLGLSKQCRKYLWQMFCAKPSLKNIVKVILNRPRLRQGGKNT